MRLEGHAAKKLEEKLPHRRLRGGDRCFKRTPELNRQDFGRILVVHEDTCCQVSRKLASQLAPQTFAA